MKENIITKEIINKYDKNDMFSVLAGFPAQVEEALEIGNNAPSMPNRESEKFLVLGMGGSAIGGDLLSTYTAAAEGLKHIDIRVNRDYGIPGNIDKDTAIIASSYSGGTEETISSLSEAAKISENIICITTGGQLGKIAKEKGLNSISIPSGLMPRCALGYSFFPMLKILLKSSALPDMIINSISNEIEETLELLRIKSRIYSDLNDKNPAIETAAKLKGTVPVIYSSNKLRSVNLRWRCQIQENAKNLSFGNILPEMNHNEINSWSNPEKFINNFSAVLLRDTSDSEKIKARFDAVETILTEKGIQVISLNSSADSPLASMFDLIYLGDWISYYLAILNGEDPTPIPLISKLKELLSK